MLGRGCRDQRGRALAVVGMDELVERAGQQFLSRVTEHRLPRVVDVLQVVDYQEQPPLVANWRRL